MVECPYMGQLRKTAHSTYDTKYHIVWIPKYRNKVLTTRIQNRLKQILMGVAERYDFPIDTMEAEEDHVHLFVTIPPTISVSQALNLFKGISSKMLREEFHEIDKLLWAAPLWAAGYFVSTVNDKTTAATIRQYIKTQKARSRQLKLF